MAPTLMKKPEVIYARIESVVDRKEYQRRGRCVRLLAVNSSDFDRIEDPEGIEALTVDVSYWKFCEQLFGQWWDTKRARKHLEQEVSNDVGEWYELTLGWGPGSKDGYLYPTFSETPPSYFHLNAVRTKAGPRLSTVAPKVVTGHQTRSLLTKALTESYSLGSGRTWRLLSFHVGQGMCTLLTDGEQGVLLDAGAGTPILRPNYLHPASGWHNDLKTELSSLSVLDLVLSHADRDHWCLLAWDSNIRSKLRQIIVPKGAKSLALKDASVKKKVVASEGLAYVLAGGGQLEVMRSEPTRKTDNTQCLVALYQSDRERHRVMMSGDYVYKDMRKDTSAWVKALTLKTFTAVVVPHHGDEASALKVLPAASTEHAIAFFSAGDHDTWNHPNPASEQAHFLVGYAPVSDKHCSDIRSVQLAP
jgi:beta-lactamase superfamily II metal-dependent hydrolase